MNFCLCGLSSRLGETLTIIDYAPLVEHLFFDAFFFLSVFSIFMLFELEDVAVLKYEIFFVVMNYQYFVKIFDLHKVSIWWL